MNRERYEPVAQFNKERETLHLREPAEIDIRPLLLHVHHPMVALFQLFHLPFRLSWVQDILHGIFLCFFQAVARHTELLTVHQIGDNIALDRLRVLFRIHRHDKLLLEFQEFPTALLLLYQFLHEFYLFRVDCCRRAVQCECPSDEGSLTNILILRTLIHMHQCTELGHIEVLQQGEHDTTNHQLLIIGVNGRRYEDILHRGSLAVNPLIRSEQIVEKYIHRLLMLCIDGLLTSLAFMFGLQFQHGNLRDKGLQLFTDIQRRKVACRQSHLRLERQQVGRLGDMILPADIGTEHIHPLHQLLVEIRQLGILETSLPVVCHQLQFSQDGMQTVRINLMRVG